MVLFPNIRLKPFLVPVFTVLLIMHLNQALGQLQVTPGGNAQQLIENVLLGNGVTVTNVTYTGSLDAIGTFTTGPNNTNLGLPNGLILASGLATTAIGPNNQPGATGSLNFPGDALLTQLANQQTFDASVLEFDFVPQGDTMRFRYVFGSEEYPEYVGSYNDIFGFFVTGLFPAGTNYVWEANKNIAIVPGTTNTPVSINNVNNGTSNSGPCTNCAYYVNNVGGPTIQYDGFTTVLTAWCRVVPCTSYHIKIAIADAGDPVLDSGVFLEAGSFSSGGINIHFNYANPSLANYAIEGCNDGLVSFKFPYPSATGYYIPYYTSGTAIMGIDYDSVASPLLIPIGTDSAAIVIHPIIDYITEGIETVDIVYPTSICMMDWDTASIQIFDYVPPVIHTSADTLIACGDTATLSFSDSAGMAPFNYAWSTGAVNINPLMVSPLQNTTYYVTVTDLCNYSATDSVRVNLYGPFADAGPDQTICRGGAATLSASGGTSYLWSTGDSTQTITVSPQVTTAYYVTVTQFCFDMDTVVVNVNPLPVVTVSSSSDSICPGDSAILTAGGAIGYLWIANPADPSLAGQTNLQSPVVHPAVNTLYTVIGTDQNQCSASMSVMVSIRPLPSSAFTIDPQTICEGGATTITYIGTGLTSATYQWGFSGGLATGAGQGPYSVMWNTAGYKDITLTVTQKGCTGPTTLDSVQVLAHPVVNFGALNNEGCPPLEVNFLDSSVNVLPSANYLWDFGNGATSTLKSPDYIYYNSGLYNITLTVSNLNGCSDTKNIHALVNVYPVPVADYFTHPHMASILDPVIQFFDRTSGDPVTWDWDLGDGSTMSGPDFRHYFPDTGTYSVRLIVSNLYGCLDTVVDSVVIRPDYTIYFPNSFTPNGDGSNDLFMVTGTGIREIDLSIFSRWGELVFRTDDLKGHWDGTFRGSEAPTDTYVLVVYYTDVLGAKRSYFGHVNLIR